MGRAPCCDKIGLRRGRWRADEDQILINYIQSYGIGSWRSLPKNAGLLRCGKSCRLRWINYLRNDLKRGNITPEEEETIVKLHNSLGNKWSLIADKLPGRTDNEIKNYWNSHLRTKLYRFIIPGNKTLIDTNVINATGTGPSKQKRGRTSRWAMKKNKNLLLNVKLSVKMPENVTLIEEKCNEKKEDNISNARVYCMEEEREIMEPYEWLDREIKRLECILEKEEMEIKGNDDEEEKEVNVSCDDSTMTLGFEDEWLDWDWKCNSDFQNE